MRNLTTTEVKIPEQRKDELEQQYRSQLALLSPEIERLEKTIQNEVRQLENVIERLNREIDKKNEILKQENDLFSIGAINKSQHSNKIRPIQKQLNQITTELNKYQKRIRKLKTTLLEPTILPRQTEDDQNKSIGIKGFFGCLAGLGIIGFAICAISILFVFWLITLIF
jgi:protein subunit release factor A